jgi:hypothetical protein
VRTERHILSGPLGRRGWSLTPGRAAALGAFAGAEPVRAADEGGGGRGVMRRAEGASACQAVPGCMTGGGVDVLDLERLVGIEGRRMAGSRQPAESFRRLAAPIASPSTGRRPPSADAGAVRCFPSAKMPRHVGV